MRPERAAGLADQIALAGPLPDDPLQPGLRGAAPVQRRERRPEAVAVRVDRGLDQLVLGLEVVVDVPHRHAGRLGDVGEGCPLDSLLMQHKAGSGDQPLALACGRVRNS